MIRTGAGATLGLLLGVLFAFGVGPFLGMGGFAETNTHIALGYACSVSVGVLVGAAADMKTGLSNRLANGGIGGSLALLLTYVLRDLPLPWVNLVWLDGTAGPLGELPLLVLPIVGCLLGGIFGAALRTTRKATP
jgi:hypothetical protein